MAEDTTPVPAMPRPPTALTFGGSGLNRAAHLRGDRAALDAAWGDPRARVLPLWRGKPLVAGDPVAGLGWLPAAGHGLAEGAARIFLGVAEDGAPRFACDMSGWTPDDAPQGPLDGFLDRTEQVHPDFPSGTRFAELRAVMTRLSARDAELAATARALVDWHARHGFCACCGAASDMAQAGWQRDCPACGAHHFPRTDPVVIMLITRGDRVLLGRSPGWPDKMYSLLAGFVEPGETIEAAVRREVFEEAGIRVGRVDYLTSQPWPFPASLMIACRGTALDGAITVDPVELEDARWVSRQDALDAHMGIHPEIAAARPGAVARHVMDRWLADDLPPGGAG
jgi:NAD+ diphosphatase